MAHERARNEDGRGGDVIVNDSIASGRPDLPIDKDPGRETNVAIDADALGPGASEQQPASGEPNTAERDRQTQR
jgi:hypothetical protein